MMKKHITARLFGVLALALLVAGCSTATPTAVVQPPTPDLGMVRTEAAQTVIVKITLEAALNPSATPEAPAAEATTQPEAEQAATATPTAEPPAATEAPTATALPTATRRSSSSGGIAPSATPRNIPDAATLLSSTPADGTVYQSGNKFDAVWSVKNTGTTTWTTDYHIRYSRGADMSEAKRYYLPNAVKPGESIDLVADMVAPNDKGIQVGYWQFVNGNGDIIYQMYVAITVE